MATMKKIELTQNKYALVDDDDFQLVNAYKWRAYKTKHTYYALNNKRPFLMHRLIMGLQAGDRREVDHINHNGLDNRKSNLRVASRNQNNWNRKKQSGFTSQYKGVSRCSRANRYEVHIKIYGKAYRIGSFMDEIEAAKIYDRVALATFGDFACINFPRNNYASKDYLTIYQAIRLRNRQTSNKKSSNFVGVHWCKTTKRWKTSIWRNGKSIALGNFATEQEAAKAYNKYVITNKFDRAINENI